VITDESLPSCGRIFTTFPKKGMNQLILKMLHPDAEVRISIEEALNDRCVKTIDCCSPDIDNEVDTDTSIFNVVHKDSLRAARKKMQKMHRHLPPGEKRL
jgi:protein-serine/threonine kinase